MALKNSKIWAWFWPVWPKYGPQKSFWQVLPLLVVDIVPSYYPMQFKGKLINQTWENDKKPNFGLNLVPKFFLWVLPLVNIVASYHCMQFQVKLINQTWENGKKKLSFRNHFGPLAQIRQKKKKDFGVLYIYLTLDIIANYHCMQFQGKLITKLEKMAKNLV